MTQQWHMRLVKVLLMILVCCVLSSCETGGPKTIEVAGTIRGTADKGWYIVADENHSPINLELIKVLEDGVGVKFKFQASTIHTFIATPDDTLSAKGYEVGASVTRGGAVLVITREIDGTRQVVNPRTIDEEGGNIWIYGLFSVRKD